MKKLFFLTVLFLMATSVFAQERLELKQLGFKMDAPMDWFKIGEQGVEHNLNRLDLTDEQEAAMFKSLNAASKLVSYYKYDPVSKGIIPTINIAVRATRVKSFANFKMHIERASSQMKTLFENFITTAPQNVDIDGGKAWITKATYDFKDPAGAIVKLSSEAVYIYKGKYYISINFIEEKGKEDNTLLFNNVIKSIKLTDNPIKE